MKKASVISAWVPGVSLALVLVLLPSKISAQGIVYVVPQQPIGYGPVPLSNSLDFNDDGIIDYVLSSDISGAHLTSQDGNFLITGPGGLVPVTSGSVISSLGSSLDPAFQWGGGAATIGGQAFSMANIFTPEIFQTRTHSSDCSFNSAERPITVGWKSIIIPTLPPDKFSVGLMKPAQTPPFWRGRFLNPPFWH
jgi:hypothetical protein